MNKKISGLFRQAGQKRIQIRILAFILVSGFVFSGAAEFAGLPHSNEHPMTENVEVAKEQTGIMQILSTQTESDNLLLDSSQKKPANTLLSAKSTIEKHEQELNAVTEKQVKFLKDFVEQVQKILLSLDFEKALAAHGEANQKSNTEKAETEKDNAENNNQAPSITKQSEQAVTTTKAVEVTTATPPTTATATTESTTVAETTASATSYPLSIPTISSKTIPSDILFDKNGIPQNYSRVIEGKASAYYQGTITATGTRAVPGSVAVNPRNIPYGTRLWIVSTDGKYNYGYAVAEDTGGFIHWTNGPVVDLRMNTHSECYSFGVRNVKIYVLD